MARVKKVVLDASVVVKWFIDESWSDVARKLVEDYRLGKVDLLSVELLPFEVLNATRFIPDLGIEELKILASILDKLHLDLRPLKDALAERTIENAMRYGLTVYASSYLSLGEIEELTVFTADERLLRKVEGTCIQHISKYLL